MVKVFDGSSMLSPLVGKQLEGVCFVLDYVTFQFEEFVFAALSNPFLTEHRVSLEPSHSGYRDGLCRQIGRVITSVEETTRMLSIVLEGEVKIQIHLDSTRPPGPEMAMLSSKGMFLCSWVRPGS